MSGITPSQRSKSLLTSQGYLVAVVESWKRFPKAKCKPCPMCHTREQIAVRSDLLGFADLIAFHPVHRSVMLVQVTTRDHHADRRTKVLSSMEAKLAILSGCCVVIHSWKESTAKLKRSWELSEEQIHLADYDSAPHYPSTTEQLTAIRQREKHPEMDFDRLPF